MNYSTMQLSMHQDDYAANKRKHNRQQTGWTRRCAPRLCCGRYNSRRERWIILALSVQLIYPSEY